MGMANRIRINQGDTMQEDPRHRPPLVPLLIMGAIVIASIVANIILG